MPKYVDGYVLPVPSKNLTKYRAIATKCSKIFLEYGALEVRECVAENMRPPFGAAFPDMLKLKKGETVVFSWIVFKSRKQRDKINALVMNDPRVLKMCDPKKPFFDCARMVCGGFTTIVDAVV